MKNIISGVGLLIDYLWVFVTIPINILIGAALSIIGDNWVHDPVVYVWVPSMGFMRFQYDSSLRDTSYWLISYKDIFEKR